MKYNRPKESREIKSGTLFVVSTPIGNLEDITLRALKILNEVDLIAAENTRHTRRLCSYYHINGNLTSYNQHNRRVRGPALIEKLRAGSDIALVTSSGTPVLSDPGSLLIKMAFDAGIRVSPVPGPSAAIAAVSVCGLRVDRFIFWGFLSSKSGKRRKELKELKNEQRPIVFFEAPHRIESMLKDLNEIFGDRYVVVLRELTKVYEEIIRGPVSDIIKEMRGDRTKGEFTVISAGENNEKKSGSIDREVRKKIKDLLLADRTGVKEIAKRLSDEQGLNYRVLYRECLRLKQDMEK